MNGTAFVDFDHYYCYC